MAPQLLLWNFAAGITVLYLFLCLQAGRQAEAMLAMMFQLSAFASAWLILAYQDRSGRMTIGNIGKLYACLCGAYLVFPSLLWFAKVHIAFPYGEYITDEIGIHLLWLHGAYLLAFFCSYAFMCGSAKRAFKIPKHRIPSTMPGIVVCTLLLALLVAGRIWTGGSVGLERSTVVQEAHLENVEAVRSGGIRLVLYQGLNRFNAYICCFSGLFVGMAFVRGRASWTKRAGVLLGAMIIAVLLLAVSGGGRGPLILVLLAALVTVDYLAGPVKWKYLVAAALVGMVFAEYIASVRASTDQVLSSGPGMERAQEYPARFFELTVMFSKEAAVVSAVQETGVQWGWTHLIRSALKVVPRQLLPAKENWQSIAEYLRAMLLQSDAGEGTGVAGTAVGDGYITGGILGVIIVGIIAGGILGLCQNRLAVSMGAQGGLWSIVPIAFLNANLIFVLRSDLTSLFDVLVMGVIPLWVIVRLCCPPGNRGDRGVAPGLGRVTRTGKTQ